jgi:hypothetical protein
MSKNLRFKIEVNSVNLKSGKIKTEFIPFDKVTCREKTLSELNSEQIRRIKRIYSLIGSFLGITFEDWEKHFTFDIFPENDIMAWEKITFVFLEYTKRYAYDLTLQQKKNILIRLLRLSCGAEPHDQLSKDLLSFCEYLFQTIRESPKTHEDIKNCDHKNLYENPWNKIDFIKLAFVYQKYINQRDLNSEEEDDIYVRLLHLMAGKEPKDDISRELLHVIENEFDPQNITDDRERVVSVVVQRKGQAKFRSDLLKAYQGKCAITGFATKDTLQAAHIIPYLGYETNHPSNGILLRADIHILFDKHLLSIDPKTYEVVISPSLYSTEYEGLSRKKLLLPEKDRFKPNSVALEKHYQTFFKKCEK